MLEGLSAVNVGPFRGSPLSYIAWVVEESCWSSAVEYGFQKCYLVYSRLEDGVRHRTEVVIVQRVALDEFRYCGD